MPPSPTNLAVLNLGFEVLTKYISATLRLSYSPLSSSCRLVSVGSGSGVHETEMLHLLHQHFPKFNVVAVDPNPGGFRKTRGVVLEPEFGTVAELLRSHPEAQGTWPVLLDWPNATLMDGSGFDLAALSDIQPPAAVLCLETGAGCSGSQPLLTWLEQLPGMSNFIPPGDFFCVDRRLVHRQRRPTVNYHVAMSTFKIIENPGPPGGHQVVRYLLLAREDVLNKNIAQIQQPLFVDGEPPVNLGKRTVVQIPQGAQDTFLSLPGVRDGVGHKYQCPVQCCQPQWPVGAPWSHTPNNQSKAGPALQAQWWRKLLRFWQ
eukprot:TRINITY_DN75715_c0_g1_i1.p1 TRINITY_DN75715_c0_g1~~TRINITY_DN75715_c0_g1_i1.p1  ORF type:complete len:317 (+),score=20.21 TRINITY_DN75715_c0_g1_i1:41-991(+)